MQENSDPLYQRLSQLYQADRLAFEKERLRLIQQAIDSFDPASRRKAQGLQFRIDCQLSRYQDPVMRMNKMVEIFWEGVMDFREVLSDPAGFRKGREKQLSPGKVLSFGRC